MLKELYPSLVREMLSEARLVIRSEVNLIEAEREVSSSK